MTETITKFVVFVDISLLLFVRRS